jgi:hypothetical protein
MKNRQGFHGRRLLSVSGYYLAIQLERFSKDTRNKSMNVWWAGPDTSTDNFNVTARRGASWSGTGAIVV